MNTTEQDFNSRMEEKPRADEAAKKTPEANPSPHERHRTLREEFNRRIEEQRKHEQVVAKKALEAFAADRERKRKEWEETNRRLRGGR